MWSFNVMSSIMGIFAAAAAAAEEDQNGQIKLVKNSEFWGGKRTWFLYLIVIVMAGFIWQMKKNSRSDNGHKLLKASDHVYLFSMQAAHTCVCFAWRKNWQKMPEWAGLRIKSCLDKNLMMIHLEDEGEKSAMTELEFQQATVMWNVQRQMT